MQRDLTYGLLATAEEALEMVGSSLFFYALLRHLAKEMDSFGVLLRVGA